VLRNGTDGVIELEVTRRQIIINPVTHKIEGDIGI